jgi:hypothetical protein
MTELSFLIDLLLNQKLNKTVKSLIADRIRFIEKPTNSSSTQAFVSQSAGNASGLPAHLLGQAPSTIANFMKEQSHAPVAAQAPVLSSEPAGAIISPLATQALASREQAIAAALSGKPEPGRKSPRKF